MTPTQFDLMLQSTRRKASDRTTQALRLVLVDGYSASAAAKATHLSRGALYHAIARLRSPHNHCQACGHPLPIHHTAKEQQP